jgi:hypothetical protein
MSWEARESAGGTASQSWNLMFQGKFPMRRVPVRLENGQLIFERPGGQEVYSLQTAQIELAIHRTAAGVGGSVLLVRDGPRVISVHSNLAFPESRYDGEPTDRVDVTMQPWAFEEFVRQVLPAARVDPYREAEPGAESPLVFELLPNILSSRDTVVTIGAVFGSFALIGLLALPLSAAGETGMTILILAMPVICIAAVIGLPRLVRNKTSKIGRLRWGGDTLSVEARRDGAELGRFALGSIECRIGSYEVGRPMARYPVLELTFPGRPELSLSVTTHDPRWGWRGEPAMLSDSRYSVSTSDWPRLVEALGRRADLTFDADRFETVT